MTARAIRPLAGPFGTFPAGALITGVPDEVVSVWVRDRAAEYLDAPVPATPEPPRPAPRSAQRRPETATTRAPERAVLPSPAPPRPRKE